MKHKRTITVGVEPTLLGTLDGEAKRENRTRTNMAEVLLAEALEGRGHDVSAVLTRALVPVARMPAGT